MKIKEQKQSVLETIRDCLSDGFRVYYPGQHKGNCTEEYIVVSLAGSSQLLNVSSERPLYNIMLFVPFRNYSRLEKMLSEVKEKMKQLYPRLEYAGNETEPYYEESNSSWMLSFQYQGIRKIERW